MQTRHGSLFYFNPQLLTLNRSTHAILFLQILHQCSSVKCFFITKQRNILCQKNSKNSDADKKHLSILDYRQQNLEKKFNKVNNLQQYIIITRDQCIVFNNVESAQIYLRIKKKSLRRFQERSRHVGLKLRKFLAQFHSVSREDAINALWQGLICANREIESCKRAIIREENASNLREQAQTGDKSAADRSRKRFCEHRPDRSTKYIRLGRYVRTRRGAPRAINRLLPPRSVIRRH